MFYKIALMIFLCVLPAFAQRDTPSEKRASGMVQIVLEDGSILYGCFEAMPTGNGLSIEIMPTESVLHEEGTWSGFIIVGTAGKKVSLGIQGYGYLILHPITRNPRALADWLKPGLARITIAPHRLGGFYLIIEQS